MTSSLTENHRQLLQDVLDYLQDEWLPVADDQHPNDRDGIEHHQAERPALLDRLQAALE